MRVHVLQGEHGSRVAEIMSLAKLTKSIPPCRGFSTRLTGSRRRNSRKWKGKSPTSLSRILPSPFDTLATKAERCIAEKKLKFLS